MFFDMYAERNRERSGSGGMEQFAKVGRNRAGETRFEKIFHQGNNKTTLSPKSSTKINR